MTSCLCQLAKVPYNEQLMTPRQLFNWACSSIPAVYFWYCSNEDYAKEQSILECHFQLSLTIPCTRKLVSFVPISESTVGVKFYPSPDVSRKERVALAKNDIPRESIAGFVTCLHGNNWWLAFVLEVCSDTMEVKLMFFYPHGPSNSFNYPESQNIHTIPIDDILTLRRPKDKKWLCVLFDKKEMTLLLNSFTLYHHSNKLVLHAFVTTCLCLHETCS